MEITHEARITKTKSAAMQTLEGEAVLLNLANNQYYRLDADSLRIFSVLTGSPDIGTAQETLAQEYNVSAEVLWQDLQEFITALAEAGLVSVVNEPLG